MNSITTFQYFDAAFRSGQLVPIIRRMNADRAIESIPILTNSNLQDMFIQNLCNFLNSNNIILNGSIGDIEIIANYICTTVVTDVPTVIADVPTVVTDAPTVVTDAPTVVTSTMDIATTEQLVNLAYSSGYLLQKIIDIGGSSGSIEWFMNTIANCELKNAFIRGLYLNLNFYNILLTGKDHDMRIIAEYVLINYNYSMGEIEMVD